MTSDHVNDGNQPDHEPTPQEETVVSDPSTAETLVGDTGDADGVTTTASTGLDLAAGERIGHYRLRQPVGEGGFGTVYEADQLEPVKRRVALKIIKLGMDTKEVIARFEAERQALAMMDHPHIAKVFDAGATDSGRPYFVMEFVAGEPITSYCDRRQLDLEQRLDLFIQVCRAVQHAHQKGIIHRDIKPSNVLVSEIEGKPVPKVIDFGIAKATNQRLTEKTYFTQQAQLIGTPEYMSPEQAEVSAEDVDTRSDIYSLGVVLYELLTGSTPFLSEDLRSAGYVEIQRIIREEEPPRPSTRASSLGARLERIAEARHARADRLARSLRGELDWIVMKCLEKDRIRRYETANGLVMDLQRYLANEPVTASPPSKSYRLRKLVARNRSVFATGAVMAMLLIAGVIGTSVGLVRAKQAEADALNEATKASMTATFLTDMLEGVGPSVARGRDTELLEEILAQTDERIEAELDGQPAVEGTIRSFLGTTYQDLGDFEKADEQFRRALELHREAYGDVHRDVAMGVNNVAHIRWSQGDYAAAESLFTVATDMRRNIYGEHHQVVVASQRDRANVLVALGRYAEAETLLVEVIAIQRNLDTEADVEDLGVAEDLAISLNSLGNVMLHMSRPADAEPLFIEALALHTEALGADHPFTVTDLHNLGWAAYMQDDFATAEVRFGEALKTSRRIYGDAHPKLIEALGSYGRVLERLARYDEAVAAAREAVAMATEIHGPDNLDTAHAMGQLALILSTIGQNEESDRLNLQILEIEREQLGEDHPKVLTTLNNIAYGYFTQGDLERAEKEFRDCLVAYDRVYGRVHKDTAQLLNNYGRVVRSLGRLDEAEQIFIEAMEIRAEVAGPDHLLVALSRHDLARVRHYQGRLDEAVEMLEACLAKYLEVFGPHHNAGAYARRDLAQVELDRNNPERARELMVDARAGAVAALGEEDDLVLTCDVIAAGALSEMGLFDEADALFAANLARYEGREPSKRKTMDFLYGQHLARQGSYDQAESILAGVYELDSEKYGDMHYGTQKTIRAIVAMYEAEGADGAVEAARWRRKLI